MAAKLFLACFYVVARVFGVVARALLGCDGWLLGSCYDGLGGC